MRGAFVAIVAALIGGCGVSFGGDDIGGLDTRTMPSRQTNDAPATTDHAATNDTSNTTSAPLQVDAGATKDAASTPASTGPMHAFVTSAIVTGNLGGVTGADALCNDLAKKAGLAGTYVAWISTTKVNAIDRVTGTGPWVRVDGQEVAKDKTQLASGQLTNPLRRTEKGDEPPVEADRTWTATTKDGKYDGFPDCNGWAGSSGTGGVGEAEHDGSKWTALLVDEACTEVNRVYCFQQ